MNNPHTDTLDEQVSKSMVHMLEMIEFLQEENDQRKEENEKIINEMKRLLPYCSVEL